MNRVIRTVVAALAALTCTVSTSEAKAPNASLIYVVSKSMSSLGAGNELSQIGLQSGAVLHRISESKPADLPNLVLDRSGTRLWWLEDAGLRSRLMLLDSRSWTVDRLASLANAMRYIIYGPSRLQLAEECCDQNVGGSRLFVYEWSTPAPGVAVTWLTVYDPTSLRVQVRHIAMKGCGVAIMSSAAGRLVVACDGSADVRIVNVRTLHVVRVSLRGRLADTIAGVFPTAAGRNVYVVDRQLRIVELDPVSGRIVRTGAPAGPNAPSSPVVDGAALLSDGHTLVVGSMADARETDSAFSLRVVDLRTMKLLRTVAMPHYVHVAAAPDGGLLLFPMGDSADRDWRITWMDTQLTESRTVAKLDGPVFWLTS